MQPVSVMESYSNVNANGSRCRKACRCESYCPDKWETNSNLGSSDGVAKQDRRTRWGKPGFLTRNRGSNPLLAKLKCFPNFKLNEVVVWLSSQDNQYVGMSMGVRRKRLWRQRGNNLRLPCSLTFLRKDEVPHTDAPIAPPESEMAGVLAGSEF